MGDHFSKCKSCDGALKLVHPKDGEIRDCWCLEIMGNPGYDGDTGFWDKPNSSEEMEQLWGHSEISAFTRD